MGISGSSIFCCYRVVVSACDTVSLCICGSLTPGNLSRSGSTGSPALSIYVLSVPALLGGQSNVHSHQQQRELLGVFLRVLWGAGTWAPSRQVRRSIVPNLRHLGSQQACLQSALRTKWLTPSWSYGSSLLWEELPWWNPFRATWLFWCGH